MSALCVQLEEPPSRIARQASPPAPSGAQGRPAPVSPNALQDGAPQQSGSPALATALSALAAAYLKAASFSLSRTSAVTERLPTVAGTALAPEAADAAAALAAAAPAAQQALRGLLAEASSGAAAARQAAAAVASKLALAEDGEAPGLAAAQAAYGAYRALRQALCCEGLAAVVSLRLQEGQPAAPAAVPAPPPEPAAGGPYLGGREAGLARCITGYLAS